MRGLWRRSEFFLLEQFEVNIPSFNQQRVIRVYLPPNYKTTNKHFPVLYMHDGQYLFRDEDTKQGVSWRIAEYLDKSGYEVIVVGIDCARGLGRVDEYGPWENDFIRERINGEKGIVGGLGDVYVDFIVNELKPSIDKKYRTDTEDTSMAGSSMGGLITLYAACKYPTIFKKLACLSSAFWFNEEKLKKRIEMTDFDSIKKLYIDIGTNEDTGRMSSEEYLACNLWAYGLLKERVSKLKFTIVENGVHSGEAWRERFPRVIEFLYGG